MGKSKKFSNKPDKGAIQKDTSGKFNFKWSDSQKAPKAQVFRKKEKTASNIDNANASSNKNESNATKEPATNTEKQQFSDKVERKQNQSNKFERNFNKDTDNFEAKTFIKRKRKKDKLLAKQNADEDIEVEQKTSGSGHVSHSLFGEKHKDIYVNLKGGVSVSEKVFSTSGKKFDTLDIHKYVISNLEKHNLTTLTNVQEKSIPTVLTGKNTLIRSQTGTGKTLAYAVPIIDALQGIIPKIKRSDGVQAMIVVPTRELALQVHELFNKINTFQWIIVGHLCGGENRKSEKDRIRKGINVLIGTPGRLLDHVLHTGALKVNNIRCLVLDEADRLLDMGFRKDIISLVEQIDKSKEYAEYDPLALLKGNTTPKNDHIKDINQSSLPPLKDVSSKERQTILLSATLTKAVSELADFCMKDHVYIDALDAQESHVISESYIIPSTVKQNFIMTYVKHRLFTLSALLVEKSKQNAKIFVFMASGQMVEYHHELFTRCLVRLPVSRGKLKVGKVMLLDENEDESDEEEEIVLDTEFFKLHGSMDQKARKEVFNGFRAAKKGVLLCTDVAARGLDVPEADCIIQYTCPQNDEDYLHRVGRTGRMGKSGSAYLFLTHEEQEYITRLRDHKVFLKKKDPKELLQHLCDLMEEPDEEKAATALQKRFESALVKDRTLYTSACTAYSSWARFYNAYPSKLRSIFDFKKLNLGHYVTSFAIRDTPSQVAKVVRGKFSKVEQPRLNRKLANHKLEDKPKPKENTKKRKSISLVTSEFASGLEPLKKKKKQNNN